tara:strand:- start:4337 stop:4759 length:423 start_codon:yes stop_codon:yes gene_type:complete
MKLDNEKLKNMVMEVMISILEEDEGKIICPNCGHHNDADVDKCSNCGHSRSKGNWKKAKKEEMQEALPAAAVALGTAAKGYAAGEAADSVASKGIKKAKDMLRLSDPKSMDKGSRIALQKISRLAKRIERIEAALKRILP